MTNVLVDTKRGTGVFCCSTSDCQQHVDQPCRIETYVDRPDYASVPMSEVVENGMRLDAETYLMKRGRPFIVAKPRPECPKGHGPMFLWNLRS